MIKFKEGFISEEEDKEEKEEKASINK